MSKRIKTYLKFQRSDRDGVSFVSYVKKTNGSWRGCHESDESKKKVALVDVRLAETLIENVLYSTTLIPMKECDGFVAISATPVRFKATIETKMQEGRWTVEVRFGHKVITYDPESTIGNRRHIDGIVQTLMHRIDIKNPEMVVQDFVKSAQALLDSHNIDNPE